MQVASKKKSRLDQDGSRLGDAMIILAMIVVCFVTIYPLYYVFILSISEPIYASTLRVYVLPKGLFFDTYKIIMRTNLLWRSYLNTIIYVVAQTGLTLLTSVLAGYVLTNKRFAGRKLVTVFLLIPMYFGGGMIPTYLLIAKLGLLNTYSALILPGAYSIWYIILTRTFFLSIPEEVRESARMDGANNFTTLFRIYLPLSKPIMAVIGIYCIVGVWNSWFSSNIYQSNEKIQPLQMFLRRVLVEQTVDMSKGMTADEAAMAAQKRLTSNQLKYAMIVFSTLPVLVVYPFLQKYFVKGVMLGSLKG